MIKLNINDIYYFEKRFGNCYDGILREITIHFASSTKTVRINLSVKDTENLENDGWVNLILEISNVSEYRIEKEDRVTYKILSDGIKVDVFAGLYFLDFSPITDEPENVISYRESKLYFVGKSICWDVQKYSENIV